MKTRALGIDIGGTKIAAGVVGADGAVTHKHVVATPAAHGAPAILEAAIDAGQQSRAAARLDGVEVATLGVGTAGHVDRVRGVISYASATLPGWT
ncbi:MAG: ROK family protein, partial [Chloroflexota bacterium]|nr:ROK family protein [Chloroflexota bacterium]